MALKRKAKKKTKLPSKRTINLVMREERQGNVRQATVGVAAILVAAILIGKFAVADQYARLSAVELTRSDYAAQYEALEQKLADYDLVESEYRKYSMDWMSGMQDGSYVAVDRTLILDLVEKVMMRAGTVNSLSITGSTMVATMSGMNLEQMSAMFAALDQQPIVDSVSLTIAATDKAAASAELDFSITVTLQPEQEAAQ